MKKIYYVGITILLLMASTFLIVKLSKPDKGLVFTTFKKSYNYVSEISEEEEIIILLSLNQADSFVTQKESIDSCYITDKNENNKRQLILSSIEFYRLIELKDEQYYEYKYSFRFNIEANCEEDYLIDDAYLILNIVDENPIKINIGNFNYYKVNKIQDDQNIRISKIKGVVNTVNNRKRVVALNIRIENNTNQELKTKRIEIFNNNIMIDGDKSVVLENDISHSRDINELISDYDYLEITSSELMHEISANHNLDLLVPIVYKQDIVSNEFGFSIIYEIDSVEYKYIYDDFLYFDNINYEEKQIKDLHFYYYESN